MRELKIFAVVAFFSLLTYYLVEPFAHHELHKKLDPQGNELIFKTPIHHQATVHLLSLSRYSF